MLEWGPGLAAKSLGHYLYAMQWNHTHLLASPLLKELFFLIVSPVLAVKWNMYLLIMSGHYMPPEAELIQLDLSSQHYPRYAKEYAEGGDTDSWFIPHTETWPFWMCVMHHCLHLLKWREGKKKKQMECVFSFLRSALIANWLCVHYFWL